jgi:hypothetical protein
MVKIIRNVSACMVFFLLVLSAEALLAVGYLTVKVESGWFVLLDSQLVADRSFENMALHPGDYRIHTYDPGDLIWQSRGIMKIITIRQTETLSLDLTAETKLNIFSDPPGSSVYVDDLYLGQTPLLGFASPYPDGKLFRVTRDGYQEISFIKEADKVTYTVMLRTDRLAPALSVLKKNNNENRLKWLREGLIITSLAGSWLSFIFKREADANYKKYLQSARPEDMKKYYDRTVTFDHYAEITVGISLVSLGGYFYLLITD